MIQKTKPFNILNYILWPIIQLLWESFSIKHAHFWHWMKYEKQISKFAVINRENVNEKEIKNRWDVFFQLNLKWNSCVILKPKESIEEFRVGYNYNNKQELSSIILRPNETFGMLIGPGESKFFALSLENDLEIELEIIGFDNKKNLRKNKITLY